MPQTEAISRIASCYRSPDVGFRLPPHDFKLGDDPEGIIELSLDHLPHYILSLRFVAPKAENLDRLTVWQLTQAYLMEDDSVEVNPIIKAIDLDLARQLLELQDISLRNLLSFALYLDKQKGL